MPFFLCSFLNVFILSRVTLKYAHWSANAPVATGETDVQRILSSKGCGQEQWHESKGTSTGISGNLTEQ